MKKIYFLLFFSIQLLALAQPSINQPDDIIIYEFPFDGFATFDLTINEDEILNGTDPSTVTITYYETLIDAQTQSFAIPNPTSWMNIANPSTIYVNVVDNSTGLFSTTSFNIEVSDDVVNIPDGQFLQSIIQQGVDTNNSGNIQSFEAEAVTILSIGDQVLNVTGLEAFINVTELYSNYNNLSNFNITTLEDLEKLDISVPFSSGGVLDLSNNVNLKELTIFNTSMNSLDLSNNILLEKVNLTETLLSTLDLTNNVLLEDLTVQSYNLTTLDLSNNSNLESLFISGNLALETVFLKNGSDESTNMDSDLWENNWSIASNPNLQYVCADEFQVAEILSFAQGAFAVNPFCEFEPGGAYNTVSGVTQFDVNNDGCDTSDPFVPFLNIEVGNGPATLTPAVTSDSAGVYNLYFGQTGDYTIQPILENPSYFNINPNFPIINIPFLDNSTTTQDFCLTANGVFADAEVVIAPIEPSRPGFDARYKLVYKNKGNQTLSGNVSFEYDDAVLDFVSSTVNPDIQNTGVLTFNFTNLLPFESRALEITLNVNSPTETPPINIDDILDYTSQITIDQAEETPEDNTFDFSEVVIGAFDPNDITCLQGDIVPDSLIGEFLHYVIRFENTGNAPAENVVVTSEINANDYNINTLQVLNASHDMYARNNNGVIEFVFENIQLSGSGGQGNILLKVKTKQDLVTNDDVEIDADIFFDFNFPITTNTATTVFSNLSLERFNPKLNINIFPNPTTSDIFVESDSNIQSITIYDVNGRKILNKKTESYQTNLSLSAFENGIYFMLVKTGQGELSRKIVKK
jgi:hypothetical protein